MRIQLLDDWRLSLTSLTFRSTPFLSASTGIVAGTMSSAMVIVRPISLLARSRTSYRICSRSSKKKTSASNFSRICWRFTESD